MCAVYHRTANGTHEVTGNTNATLVTNNVDLFQLDGKHYLVSVDHYSGYFELDVLKNTTASTVIRAMKRNLRDMESLKNVSATMAHSSIVRQGIWV